MFSFDKLVDKIKKWYQGEYISPVVIPHSDDPSHVDSFDHYAKWDDPDDSVVVISPGYYKQSPLAKTLGRIGNFWLNHWQWILLFLISVAGLIIVVLLS